MCPASPTCICGDCRTCRHRAAQARYREKNRERLNAKHAAWRATKDGVEASLEAWANVTPLVQRARRLVRTALERGELVRGGCERAAEGDCLGKIEGHHDDYAKPLEVRWLCQRHHHEADAERREQAA